MSTAQVKEQTEAEASNFNPKDYQNLPAPDSATLPVGKVVPLDDLKHLQEPLAAALDVPVESIVPILDQKPNLDLPPQNNTDVTAPVRETMQGVADDVKEAVWGGVDRSRSSPSDKLEEILIARQNKMSGEKK